MPWGSYGFYQPSFFDTDFRYLDKKDAVWGDFWDPLKRIHPNDCWLFSMGGQAWYRHVNEVNSRLEGRGNNYGLFRGRLYADAWYRDEFRVYVEGIYADSFWQDLAPLPIDRDRGDFLNLFVEIKAGELNDRPVYVRVGRQEMLFGSQRLVSTLDWANTRRTFQGVRAYRADEKFDVDLFWVQPVIPEASRLDSVDNNQNFAGLWTTYKPRKGTSVDAYYLFLDNTNPVAVGEFGARSGFNAHTLGTRYAGDYCNVLWDFEAMLQLGEWSNQTLVAGSTTAGLGYHWKDRPMNPQAWVYYDWASGESHPGQGGTRNTFQQLFPFGHYYFGYLDLIGRQNIHDLSAQFVLFPEKWITLIMQGHRFWLAEPGDSLYAANGRVLRNDATGRAGQDVGTEIDLVASFHLTAHSDLLFGFSKLFRGTYIENTGPAVSPELYYVQYGYRW
ncbi:MAG: alginate export family protein [Gemmataceae bacterium]|nr:alginate export family protein [Gemmataceae bacterium]